MNGSADPLAEACERLVGQLLASAARLPELAEAPGAPLRAPVVAALRAILSIAPAGKMAEAALELVGRVLRADDAEPEPPASRASRPGSIDPAVPPFDLFRLLAVQPAREDNAAVGGLYDILLRPDFSFMAGALTPPPGIGPRLPKPLETRVDRAIEELRRRISTQLDGFDRLIARYLDKVRMPRTARVAVELNAEYITLYRRLTIAAVFSGGGLAIDLINRFAEVGRADNVLAEAWERVKRFFTRDVGSDERLGTAVHRELQERYRRQHLLKMREPRGPRFPILQENNLYEDGLRERPVPLAVAAQSAEDGSLRALHYARQPYRLALRALDEDFENVFREDCLDIRRGELWEIKPIRSCASGVAQELHYRGSFNLVNALLQDLAALPGDSPLRAMARRIGILHEGGFSCPEGARAGTSNAWDKGRIKKPWVDRNRRDRRGAVVPRTIFVVTVPDQLPGLVIYVIFIVRGAVSAVLLAAIAAVIERLLREYARDLEKIERDFERGVAMVIGVLLAAAIVYLLFLLALEAAAVLAGAIAAIAAALMAALGALGIIVPVLAAGEAETFVRRLALGAFGPMEDGTPPRATLLADRLLIEYPESASAAGDIGASDVLVSGLVELKRMPAGRWAAVSALLGICASVAFGALAKGVEDNPLPAGPTV